MFEVTIKEVDLEKEGRVQCFEIKDFYTFRKPQFYTCNKDFLWVIVRVELDGHGIEYVTMPHRVNRTIKRLAERLLINKGLSTLF